MEFGARRHLPRSKMTSQAAILCAIYHFGPVKRSQIAEYLGLTMPTITTNVNDMMTCGIVRETGLTAPQPGYSGRRARPVDIVPESRHFIGIEMQGTRWAICLLDFRGKAVYARNGESLHQDHSENIKFVCQMIQCAVSACGMSLEDITGIGICTPGLVNRTQGILEMRVGCNWSNKDIRRDIAALSGYAGPISVENNACARAYGVQLFQPELLTEGRSFAYLFISDGIACPLMPVTANPVASVVGMGELGHMIMDPEGPLCRCGNRGCLEAYSSDWAVLTRCKQALEQGKAPILRELCGEQRLSMETIIAAQDAGDRDVDQILRQAMYVLGLAVVNINNFAGPSLMTIEGKLFRNKANQDMLLDVVQQNLCSVIRSHTELVFVEPNHLSGAKGAAALSIFRALETYDP